MRATKRRSVIVPERPRVPVGAAVRMFVVGALAVAAAGYGAYHHFFERRGAAARAGGEREIPAPELEVLPSDAPRPGR